MGGSGSEAEASADADADADAEASASAEADADADADEDEGRGEERGAPGIIYRRVVLGRVNTALFFRKAEKKSAAARPLRGC